MLGQIQNLEGNEGEGGAGLNKYACRRWEQEPMEPLLLLVQVTQANGRPLPVGRISWLSTVIVYSQCMECPHPQTLQSPTVVAIAR